MSQPETRTNSATVKQRVSEKSAQRKEEKHRLRAAELKDNEEFLEKARQVAALPCPRLTAVQVPMDILALQWLGDTTKAPDTRLYLVENILPTLVVALERLLQHADEAGEDFNSINWLAQWLTRCVPRSCPTHMLRNNPRYVKSSATTSPYVASLKSVEAELRLKLLAKTS